MSQNRMEMLKEAILSQAERDRQRLLTEAESQAGRIVAQAEAEATAQRSQLLEQAESRVVGLKREVKGSARLEAQAVKTRERESLLNDVFNRAADALAAFDQHEDYQDVIVDLILDAVRHLGEARSVVILADDVARDLLGEAMLQYLEEQSGRAIALGDPLPQDDDEHRRLGVVMQSKDGRLRYNNTLQARLARTRSALRTSTYRILMGADG